jgi:hypothetical protein
MEARKSHVWSLCIDGEMVRKAWAYWLASCGGQGVVRVNKLKGAGHLVIEPSVVLY